jgi:hypothetical protein
MRVRAVESRYRPLTLYAKQNLEVRIDPVFDPGNAFLQRSVYFSQHRASTGANSLQQC